MASFAALAIGGCAVAPVPETADAGVAVPVQWSTAAAPGGDTGTPLAAWWARFHDPLLTELVARSLARSTDVESARARLRQARALRDEAAAALWPSLGAAGSVQRSTGSAAQRGNVFQGGLDAGWEPDVFGASRHGVRAGDADAQASAASLGAAQVSVAAETVIAYLQLRGAQSRLAIARDNLASQQETLQITQWRADAGLVSSVNVQQALAAVAQTQAQLPPLAAAIVQSRHALAVLTGEAPDVLHARLAAPAALPQPDAGLGLPIPAQVLRQRPDVQAAELSVQAAASRVAQADASRLPAIALRASVAWSALTLGSLGSSGAVSTLLASLDAPLFDAGARHARLRAQQAQLDVARAAWRSSVLTALQEVEDTLAALSADRERLAALQQAAESAGNAALLARDRYASGLADFQTVLETQRTLLAAQDGVASTSLDLVVQHVRLYKALGGGWTPVAAGEENP